MTPRPVSPATAFLVACAGIGLFSVMDVLMKSLTLAIGTYNALFWRCALSAMMGAAVWRFGKPVAPSPRAIKLHALRGTITTVMALLFFWGLARVPMAQAITLTYVAPLLALLLAAVVLHERVGRRVVLASVAAFAGVLVVMAGQARADLGHQAFLGAVAVLVSAVLYAGNLVVARLQSQAAGPGEVAFFQSTIVAVILALAAPWLAEWPPAGEWWKIALSAALATGSLFLLAFAYAHGETGYLATTEYTSFVYAAVFGWAVFGEIVSPWTLAGAAIIVAACLFAARRRDVAEVALGVAP